MSTDIKLSKAQISKMIQWGGCLRNIIDHLGKKVITDLAIPLARDNLHILANNLASNTINKCERKISVKGARTIEKRFTLFISNGDMNNIIKIIKSLEDSDVLIDGVTETIKHKIENKKEDFSELC